MPRVKKPTKREQGIRCECGSKLTGRQTFCARCRAKRAKLKKDIESGVIVEPEVTEGKLISADANEIFEWVKSELLDLVNRRANDGDIVEWAERVFTLPVGDGWRGDRKLRFKEYPVSAFALRLYTDPVVERLIVLLGTQQGKSTFEAVAMSHAINRRGGQAVVCAPTDGLRKKTPATKLLPIWNDSPELGYVKAELNNTRFVFSSGNYIFFALASSTETLADTSGATTVFVIEHDEISPNLKHDTVSLLFDRLRFSHIPPKMVITGTPRRMDKLSLIKMFTSGDYKIYYPLVECPHCHEWIIIDYMDLHGPENVDHKIIKQNRLGYAVCRNCKEHITDAHHRKMVLNPKITDLTPDRPKIYSAIRSPSWLSTKYSFSQAVAERESAKNNPIKLAEWYRSVAAFPIDTMAINKNAESGGYEQRKLATYRITNAEIPEQVKAITAGVDVGTRGFWLVVVGWGVSGRMYVLWNGMYGPKGTSTKDWQDAWDKVKLRAKMTHGTFLGHGDKPKFFRGILDSGFDAPMVYRLCMSSDNWVPARGIALRDGLYKKTYADPENKYHGEFSRLPLMLQNTHQAHDLLESYLSTPIDSPNGIAFATDETKRMFNHLRGAVKKEKGSGYVWEKVTKDTDDHLRDALALAMIAGYSLKLNELKDEVKKEKSKKVSEESKKSSKVNSKYSMVKKTQRE